MAKTNTEHRLWLVAYDGMQALDVTGPYEVLASANRVAEAYGVAGLRYDLKVVGLSGTTVTTESGLGLVVDPLPTHTTRINTLMIPGGDSAADHRQGTPFVDWISKAGRRAERVATVCTGTFLAAEAGLLDGRRVTTHWARVGQLAKRFPHLCVDSDAIYIHDGPVWSSAGVTAGIDLALAMVEDDLGIQVAQEVARWLVVFLRRPGGQSQFAPTVWTARSGDGPVRQAQDLIDLDPAAIESVASLASQVGLSPRHLTRLFAADVGETPARYLEKVRLAAARQQLEVTNDGLTVIANRCGFGTSETLRRAFHRQLGVSPDDYRRRFSEQLTT